MSLPDIIAAHPFTKDLNPRYLHLLTQCATFECYGLQQPVFREAFAADRFYLIHSGRVAIQTFVPGQGAMTVQTVTSGEALGCSWLFPPYQWHFGAMALEPTEAVAFCAKTLRDEMEENHDFGYAIATRVGQLMLDRLQASRLRLLEIYDRPS